MKVDMSEKEIKPLSKEELAELIKKVIENPEKYPEEAKLILILEITNVDGSAVVVEESYEVLYGCVEEVILEEYEPDTVPRTKEKKIALIPKRVPTIVLFRHKTDSVNESYAYSVIYVFTGEKWVSVETNCV